MTFSPDGTAVAAGDSSNNIWMWSLVDDSQIHKFTAATVGGVRSVSYSSDGSTLAACGTGNTISLYNTSDGSLQRTLTGHTAQVNQVAFSPLIGQANLLASVSQDLTVRLWNTKTGATSSTPVTAFATQANCLAFSRDGTQLAVGGLDSTTNASARVWSVVNKSLGSLKASIVANGGTAVNVIDFSQDGTLLAAGSGTLVNTFTFTISSGVLVSSFNAGQAVTGFAFSIDGSVIASSAHYQILQSSVSTGSLVQTVTQFQGSVINVAFSPDSSQMALGLGPQIQFRSVPTGALLPINLNNSITNQAPYTFTYSPDGSLFTVTGTGCVYDLASGVILPRGGAVGSYLLVSPDDQEVYSTFTFFTGVAEISEVNVYRMSDGVQLGVNVLPGGSYVYAISNDQTRALCVTGGVSVFSLPDGATISPQPILNSGVTSNYSLSGDGSYVAFASVNAYIYRVSDGMLMLTQPGAFGTSLVAISPFGDSVAAYRGDGSITVTGIDGTPLAYWNDQFGTGISWMGYTPDASSIVIARLDGTVLVCDNPAPAALAGLSVTPSNVEGGIDNIDNPQAIVSINVSGPFNVPITLTSSDPTVTFTATGTQTTTVVIPQGATSAVAALTTKALPATSGNKTVAITAALNGVSITRNITVRPAIALKAVTLAPSTVQGGFMSIGVVTLVSAAPVGGTPVPLTGNSDVVIPAVVTVPAGLRSVKFLVQTSAVSAKQTVNISGKSGGVTISQKLILVPAALSAVSALPSAIETGENSIGVIQLVAPTLTSITVAVSSNNAAASLDVSSVTIPAGQMLGTFNITAGTVTASTPVTITAKLYGVSKTAKVTVTP